MEFVNNLKLDYGDDGITVVTVNRPKKLNALNDETIEEIRHVFEAFANDDRVGGVILTGAGDKAFIAGADIGELAKRDALGGKLTTQRGQRCLHAIDGLNKPVIAAINGYALGGGCELACACHLRVAAEHAKIGVPEVKLGIMCGFGGTQRLPRLVGQGRALELILTGEFIDAAEAFRIGLVNRVFPADELLDGARAMLATMLKRAPLSVAFSLEAVRRGMMTTLDEGLRIEADLFGLLCATEDKQEGCKAFLEKREPTWQGK